MNEITIKRILVPLDFSELTLAVLEHAVYLARLAGAELFLLNVVHVPPLAEATTWLDPVVSPTVEQDIRRQMKAQAGQKLTEFARLCAGRGVPASTLIREGVPYTEIIKAGQELHCDLILMGSQGHSALSRLLLGSVAERVVRRAACHVFCVKPATTAPESS